MTRPAFSFGLTAGVLVILLAGGMPLPQVQGKELPDDDEGPSALKKKFKDEKVEKTFNPLVNGDRAPGGKEDKAAIVTAAKWYTFRVTWDDVQRSTKKTTGLRQVYMDFDKVLKDVEHAKGNNKEFMKQFVPEVVKNLKEVLDKGNVLAQVNGAMLLHRLAQTGRPELLAELTAVLKNSRYDSPVSKQFSAIKLYAVKGIKEVLERLPAVPADPKTRTAYEGAVKAVLKYIDHKPDYKDLSAEKKKALDDVIRYVRREAVRALAQVRVPAVAVAKGTNEVSGPVAYWLLRVVGNEDLTPKASVSEQVEAAVGLLQMRSPQGSTYQEGLTPYFVGKFIETDLVRAFNRDATSAGTGKEIGGNKKKRTIKPIRSQPWKLHVARLTTALEEWVAAASKANPARTQPLARLLDNARDVLKKMDGAKSDRIETVSTEPLATALKGLVENLKLSKEVYKGAGQYEVKLEEE
jgi:hypothetical protein